MKEAGKDRRVKQIKNRWKTTRLNPTTTKVDPTPLTSCFIKHPSLQQEAELTPNKKGRGGRLLDVFTPLF